MYVCTCVGDLSIYLSTYMNIYMYVLHTHKHTSHSLVFVCVCIRVIHSYYPSSVDISPNLISLVYDYCPSHLSPSSQTRVRSWPLKTHVRWSPALGKPLTAALTGFMRENRMTLDHSFGDGCHLNHTPQDTVTSNTILRALPQKPGADGQVG